MPPTINCKNPDVTIIAVALLKKDFIILKLNLESV